jgi:hypothetical protein
MKDVKITKLMHLDDEVTRDQVSTIGECSITNNGQQILFTGNWFAAKSLNGGNSWTYLSPFDNFPSVDDGFCCDQTVLYDKSRNLSFWILQYSELNSSNTLRLAVKKGKTLSNETDWDLWDFTPKSINPLWKNQWLDYNHAALSDNFLYIGTNVFNTNDTFTRCIVIRIPLDKLETGQNISYDFFESKTDFSLRCVQGATNIMYFAAHGNSSSNNRLRVYAWPENSLNVKKTDISITPWSAADSHTSKCPDGTNWLKRTDYRITGAWLSKGVLGFMWTADKRGTDRPHPHVRVVRINAADMKRLDEPDIWSPDHAYAYPDAYPNAKADVGITLFLGGGQKNPAHVVGIFDEVAKKWRLKIAVQGTNGPLDSKWGDYIAIRPYAPGKTEWIAGAYTLQGGKTTDNVAVHAVRFKII